ncbi:MAG: hypothetical protein ACAI25_16570 [Planctomycetota bacterium]
MKRDKESFVRRISQAFVERGLGDFEYDSREFCLRFGDGESAWVANLTNVFDEYCAAKNDAQRAEIVGRFTRAYDPTEETDAALDDVLPELLPRVRELGYFGVLALHVQIERAGNKTASKEPYRPPPRLPIADHLGAIVVHDREDSISDLTANDYERWGVDFEHVFDKAQANLWRRSEEPFERQRSGLYLSPWRDNHDASRLLLTDKIRELDVDGDPVAMVPNRDFLLVTGSMDAKGLEAMADICDELREAPRPMSFVPVRLGDNDEWTTFLRDVSPAVRARFARLRVLDRARDYDEQKSLLDALHEKQGHDEFVATFMVFEDKETGQLGSLTTWSEGVRALLPATDRVAFTSADDEAQVVPWHTVVKHVSKLMKPVDGLYPERFQVAKFPSRKVLAAMGGERI